MLINSTVEVTPDIRIKLVNGKLKTAVCFSKFATRSCVRSLQDMVVEAQIKVRRDVGCCRRRCLS
jgi:hypothetical protein